MQGLNPTALLKIMGALAPLMNAEIGEQMVGELKLIFDAIKTIAPALQSIDERLGSLEQKLREMIPTPLSDSEAVRLLEYAGDNPALDSTAYGAPIGGEQTPDGYIELYEATGTIGVAPQTDGSAFNSAMEEAQRGH